MNAAGVVPELPSVTLVSATDRLGRVVDGWDAVKIRFCHLVRVPLSRATMFDVVRLASGTPVRV